MVVRTRRWLVAAATLLAAVLLLLALVPLPPVRAWALDAAIARARSEFGIDLSAERLDYRLLTLSVRLEKVRLAAIGSGAGTRAPLEAGGTPGAATAGPFFEADEVTVNLPWSVLAGRLGFDSIDLASPRVTIVRDADGASNLPALPARRGPPGPRAPIAIGSFTLRDGHVHYTDESQDFSVDADGLSIDLTAPPGKPLAGRLSVSAPTRIESGRRQTTLERIDVPLRFDEGILSLERLSLASSEADLAGSATIDTTAAPPALAAEYVLSARLAELSPWLGDDVGLGGTARVEGQASGPLADPLLTLAVSSDAIEWRALGLSSVSAAGRLTPERLEIESFRAAFGAGRVTGKGTLGFAADTGGDLSVTWTDLALGEVLDAAGVTLPIGLAARLEGRLDASWTQRSARALRLDVEDTATADRRAGALPVAGRTTLAVGDGEWRLTHEGTAGAATVDGRADGRADAATIAASPLAGTLRVSAPDLERAIADLAAAGLPLGAVASLDPAGRFDATLSLGGEIGAPSLGGPVTVDGFAVFGAEPGALSTRVRLDPTGVAAADLDARTGGAHLTGAVSARFDRRTLDGHVEGDVADAGAFLGDVDARWRPSGPAHVAATIGGTSDAPLVEVTAASGGIDVAGQRLDRLQAVLRVEGSSLSVEKLDASQTAGGSLAASGRYDLGTRGYELDVEGTALDLRPVPAGEAGGEPLAIGAEADVRFSGKGSLGEPAGEGTIILRQLTWNDGVIGPVRAKVSLAAGRLSIDAAAADLSATVDGGVGLEAPYGFTLAGELIDTDLGRLFGALAAGEPRVAGSVALGLNVSGTLDDLDATDGWIYLRRLEARHEGGVLRLGSPATIRYDKGTVSSDALDLRAGGTTVSLSGRLTRAAGDGTVDLTVDGRLEDLTPFAPALADGEDLDLAGAIDLRVTASGSSERPVIAADLDLREGRVGAAGVPPAAAIGVKAAYRDGVLDVSVLRGVWQGAVVTASGRLPARLFADWLPPAYVGTLPVGIPTARVTARLEPLTRAVLEPWVSAATLEQINLSSAASLTLEADRPALDAVRGELVLDRMAASAAGVAIAQATPTRLTIEGGRLRVAELAWTAEGARTTVSGEVGLVDRRLDLALKGTAGLRAIGAFVPTVAIGGTADVDVHLGGTLENPEPVGRVVLSGGTLQVRQPRLVVAGLGGVVDLSPGRLSTAGLTGTLNDGPITIAGELTWPDAGGAGGQLTLTGRAIALQVPQGLRTEVDTDLALAFSAGVPRLSGKVTVRRGTYRDTLVITAQLLDRLGSRTEAVDLGTPSAFDDLRLDVAVVTADPVILDNNYGRIEIDADLRIAGTLSRPSLGGQLTLEEGGQLFLGGLTYQIERGSVTFVDPTAIKPDLDLAARTQVRQYDIRLTASGTPDALTTSLTSDPSLSEADLLSLLVTGQPADESGTLVSAQTGGVQVLQLLSGDILGLAGRVVGLDSVRYEQGPADDLFGADPALVASETEPSQRLSISKRLSSQVEVVLSQNLKESGGVTWIAVWRPTRTLDARAVSRDDNSRSLQMSQQLQFGGRPPPAAPAVAPAPAPTVDAIRVVGAADAEQAAVRRAIKLQKGRPLDFYRWQEDRDAIERYYHDRGYFEAQIRVERTDVGADGSRVAVEYQIQRGPRTRLEVDGFALSDAARRDIERAWMAAVFDGFLIDDARARVLRSLARRGYVRPTVTAEVRDEGKGETAAKVLTVTVEPGPRTPNLEIQYRGNETLATERLDAEVERRGLALVAWLQPRDFEAAIRAIYQRQGRLAAVVSVGEPSVEGDTTTLPVTIDEGPAFLVGDVRVNGEVAKTEAELRTAFGLFSGDPYTPETVEAGRRAVDAEYRKAGFNRVAVRVERVVAREAGRVAVSLDISEGPRQVLANVTIEGKGPTSQGLIDNAIRAQVGEPIVADDWFQARRRLYELGVFRSADVEFEAAGEATEENGVTVQPTRARVSLVSAPLYRFRYGFDVSDEVAPGGEGRQNTAGFIADLQRRNLFGRGLTVGGTGRIESDLWLVRGFAGLPRFFSLPVTSTLYVSRSHQSFTPVDVVPYVEDRWIVTAEQDIRRGRALRLSWGYRFDRNHVFEPDPGEDNPFPKDFTVDTARLTSAFTVDMRDDPFSPRHGWFSGTTLEYAVPLLGSDIDFVKVLTQGYYFHALGPVVLASAGRLGGVFGPNSLDTELFVTGGGTTVRGYAQDSLGPVDFFGLIGGEGLLVLNQEARLRIWKWIGAVGFVDAGNAFDTFLDITLKDLKVGVGAGLRLDTPFVLLRLDYGVPVPRPEGSPFGRWYFSLGHIF